MENLNKKDLDIQAAVLNLSCMQEQVLASYRRVRAKAALALVSPRAQQLMAQYGMELQTASTLLVPEGCQLAMQNGTAALQKGQTVSQPTVLVVNGTLTLHPDCQDALESYAAVQVNGELVYPMGMEGRRGRIQVNGSSDAAAHYARAIASYQQRLPGITVYNMVVPNHSEFGLPERIRNDMGCTSQRENLSDVFENYGEGSPVVPVDIYDALDYHKDQYLYFNTDTHWAPLGAYWAYTAFCQAAEEEAAPLSDFPVTSSIEDFTGYLYAVTGESCLGENPDRIDFYEPGFSYTIELSYDGAEFTELSGMYAPDESMGYSAILWGDNPLVRITNQDKASGGKLLLVKDSYGNAIAPFLAANYREVHVADFRSFPQDLPGYCQENGITDVLFFNNVMSANTYSQVETMDALFH